MECAGKHWYFHFDVDYDLFSEMRGLSWLDISHNHLTKLPSCLGYNTELMLLRCGGNSLSTAFQALLGPMANVEPTSLSRRPAVDSLDRLYKNFVRRLQCHLRDEYDLTRGVHYRKQKPAANPPLSSVFPDFRTYSIPQLVSVDGLDVGGFGFSKRQKILRELLETEQAYVSNLQTLYDLYYQPLSNLLTPCQIAGVFGNFNVILEIHRDEILPGLQKRVAENRGVGDLFEALNPRFEVYAAYINHHDIANSLLAWVQTGSEIIGSGSVTSGRFQFPKHTKDDQFSVYALDFNFEQVEKVLRVMQVAKAHKKHAQINMGSYLIMPIQRLPRYLMLLDALAKTAPNMPSLDDVAVVRAYKHLKTIIADLNESKRKCEAQNEKVGVMLGRVRRLNYSLGVGYMTNTPISRVFVCASDSNPIRLVKYVELKHELNAGQVTSAFTLDMYGCYEYKFKEKQNSRLSYDIDTGGAIDRYDLAGVIGKRAFLILFNDLLLVCTTKREQYCVLRCVRIHSSRSRQAEFLAVSRLEGILRITDGACVVYIRGSLEFVRDWTKKINGIKQD